MRNAISSLSHLQQTISSNCIVYELSPLDFLCFQNNETITINNLESGITTSWLVSSNITILSSNDTSITVSASSSNSSRKGWVKATLSNGITLQEDFWVGKPEDLSFDGIQGNIFISSNSTEQYYVPIEKITEQGYTNYYWSVSPSSKLRIVRSHINRNDVFVQAIDTGMAEVKFHATNSCGSTTSTLYVTISNGGGFFFRAYPNPASTNLTIEQLKSSSKLKTKNSSKSFNTEFNSFNLYDFQSELVLSGKLKELTNIDVSALEKGTYILKIHINGNIETHQIIIK
tara:strand:+ start:3228 stop:4088 length:861 start_codon:yes stop_codon:yes gene_type:complete